MTVETMEEIMRCVIVPNKMCVEMREMLDMEVEKEEGFSGILVDGGLPSMWCGLVRLHGSSNVQVASGMLAALCEARVFMEDERENMRTKKQLTNHRWEAQ